MCLHMHPTAVQSPACSFPEPQAMQGLEEAIARVQLDAEKLRGADLAAAHAAMSGLKEYQEEMLRVLQFASLTENMDGEVALLEGQEFDALDSGRMAALLAAERQRAAAQRVQRQASSGSEGGEAADGPSGAQSSRAEAAEGGQQTRRQQVAAAADPASAAASACSGGGVALGNGCSAAAGSKTASAAAASTAVAGEAQPSASCRSQGPAASGSHSAAGTDGGATEQQVFVSQWLAQMDNLGRNWQAAQVPEVRSTFVR